MNFSFFRRFGYELFNIHSEFFVELSFDAEIVGFEFVAAPFEMVNEVKTTLIKFWNKVCTMPEFTDWS